MDREWIYECIPEASRDSYGKTKDEQIDNFYFSHPEIFGDLEVIDPKENPLDYMVVEITNALGQLNLAYKGGYILNKRIPNCRYTRDIDLSIPKTELYEKVKEVLEEISNRFLKEGVASSSAIKRNVTETSSGGIQFYDQDGAKIMGVDVGVHPLSYGVTSLSLGFKEVNVFTIERSLADKFSVICSPKRFRRVKDLYDVYMLITMFDVSWGKFQESEQRRRVDWYQYPLDDLVIAQLSHAYNKFTIQKAEEDIVYDKPALGDILLLLSSFVGTYLLMGDHETWSHERRRWE
jgi:predicted nucleotidyltransferase component of viral defense system